MTKTNWLVITGAPSSGKTTLINCLASIGYRIAPEIARSYIKQLLAYNNTLLQIKQDVTHLQRDILALMLKRERQFPIDEPIFFDRGTPDSLAYFRFHHLEESHVVKACTHWQYKKIFYCHGLPVVHDAIRDEDEMTARKIGEYIYKAYIDLGYQLIELPAISIEKRMDIILDHIN
jgi:predicted ATPase